MNHKFFSTLVIMMVVLVLATAIGLAEDSNVTHASAPTLLLNVEDGTEVVDSFERSQTVSSENGEWYSLLVFEPNKNGQFPATASYTRTDTVERTFLWEYSLETPPVEASIYTVNFPFQVNRFQILDFNGNSVVKVGALDGVRSTNFNFTAPLQFQLHAWTLEEDVEPSIDMKLDFTQMNISGVVRIPWKGNDISFIKDLVYDPISGEVTESGSGGGTEYLPADVVIELAEDSTTDAQVAKGGPALFLWYVTSEVVDDLGQTHKVDETFGFDLLEFAPNEEGEMPKTASFTRPISNTDDRRSLWEYTLDVPEEKVFVYEFESRLQIDHLEIVGPDGNSVAKASAMDGIAFHLGFFTAPAQFRFLVWTSEDGDEPSIDMELDLTNLEIGDFELIDDIFFSKRSQYDPSTGVVTGLNGSTTVLDPALALTQTSESSETSVAVPTLFIENNYVEGMSNHIFNVNTGPQFFSEGEKYVVFDFPSNGERQSPDLGSYLATDADGKELNWNYELASLEGKQAIFAVEFPVPINFFAVRSSAYTEIVQMRVMDEQKITTCHFTAAVPFTIEGYTELSLDGITEPTFQCYVNTDLEVSDEGTFPLDSGEGVIYLQKLAEYDPATGEVTESAL
jgi:hypothetical protein